MSEGNPNEKPHAPRERIPGELSPADRHDLVQTLVERGLLPVEEVEVERNPAYDGPERRASEMDAAEIEGIIERRGPPLPDAPAVEEAFRAVMEIAQKKFPPSAPEGERK